MKANTQLEMRSQILTPALIQLVMMFLCIGVSAVALVYEIYKKFYKYFTKEEAKEVVVFQSVDSVIKETEH